MNNQAATPCPRCQIGYLQPGLATYSCVHQGMVVSVPAMPSWKCDICQYQEFDELSLAHIEVLLGQSNLPNEGRAGTRTAADALSSFELDLLERKLSHRFNR